jgi:hypothetical protein
MTDKQAYAALTRVTATGLQSGETSYGVATPWLVSIAKANPGSTFDTRVHGGRVERVFLSLQPWLMIAQSYQLVVSFDA